MRANRCGLVIACLLVLGAWTAESLAEPNDGESVALQVPCSSVGTDWPASESGPYKLAGPQLSVVMTDLRPKDALLYLDGRFIGRARYFNSKKGLLFLQPGKYRLEARNNGFRSDFFEINASPNCRFNIKHRMIHQRGTGTESHGQSPGKGVPDQRVFGPLEPTPIAKPPTRSGRADTSLRPELGNDVVPRAPHRSLGASLKLRVRPETASVFLDDGFLATGEELESMAGPLAISVGPHQLRVEAPGFSPRTLSFQLSQGETFEREVILRRSSQ